jgi:hypothetical protein
LPSQPLTDRAPYPTRLRVTLFLSIFLWAIIALIIIWALRQF